MKSAVKNQLAQSVATLFYLGTIPFAPGTFGSFGALAIVFMVYKNTLAYVLTTVGVFLIGRWAAKIEAERLAKEDPQHIVIDEACGMLISLFLIPINRITVVTAFLIFRLLDIIKPFPARRIERVPGGYGIMLDDAIAGVYTNLILQIIVRLI